jgi:hypothetical protein
MPTIVTPLGATTVDDLWLDATTLAAATGWELKPEGLCRDDVCLLVPDELRRDDAVDVVALWTRLGRPVLTSGDALYLGEDAATKPATRAGDLAPDFTLRDLDGVEHSLSDHRGKKVFISSWAPW